MANVELTYTLMEAAGAKLLDLKNSILNANLKPTYVDAWQPPLAYAASTAYKAGQRVVNGGNIYLALTAGTTGAASAPTGTGAALIADGTVSWQYDRPTFAADANAPIISTSTTVSTIGKCYKNALGSFAPASNTLIANDNWFIPMGFYGGLAAQGIGYNIATMGETSSAGIAFMTDAPQVVLAIDNTTSDLSSSIEVDGRFVIDSVIPLAGTTGQTYITLTFNSRKPRLIIWRALRRGFAAVIRGVLVAKTDTVWKPNLPLKHLFVGDSFSVGGGTWGSEKGQRGIAANYSHALGIQNYLIDGVAGSGFVAGVPYTNAARLAFITQFAPDVITAMTSVNDDGQSQAALTAAFNTWYAAARAAAPNAVIIILGQLVRASGETLTESYIRQACAAINDEKLLFVPASGSSSGAFASGTGTVNAPANDGSGDIYWYDGLHPVARGAVYLGKRAAQATIEKLLSI